LIILADVATGKKLAEKLTQDPEATMDGSTGHSDWSDPSKHRSL